MYFYEEKKNWWPILFEKRLEIKIINKGWMLKANFSIKKQIIYFNYTYQKIYIFQLSSLNLFHSVESVLVARAPQSSHSYPPVPFGPSHPGLPSLTWGAWSITFLPLLEVLYKHPLQILPRVISHSNKWLTHRHWDQ